MSGQGETSWRHAFFGSFVASGLVMATALVTSIVTARVLGPEGRGVLAVVTTWAGLAMALSQFPIADAVILVRNERLAGRGEVNRAALALARLLVLVSLPLALVVLGAVYSTYEGVPLLFALLYVLVALPDNIFGNVYHGILQADHRFRFFQGFAVATPLVYCAFVLIAGLMQAGVEAFISIHAASLLIMFLFRYLLVDVGQAAAPVRPLRRTLARRATPLYGHSVARVFSGQIVRVTVVAVATVSETGQFVVALVFAGLFPKILGNAIRVVGLPAMRHFEGEQRVAAARRLLRMSWLASLLGAAVTALLAPVALPLLYGDAFELAAGLVPFLAAAMMLMAVSDSFVEILKSCGATRALTSATVAYVASYAVLSPALYLSGLGLFGAALALALANLLYVVALSIITGRVMPEIGGRDWLLPTPSRLMELLSLATSLARRRRDQR